MKVVYLVADSHKVKYWALERSAEDLYYSISFKEHRAFVRGKMNPGDEWYIISAKYGLLQPQTKVRPYYETVNKVAYEKDYRSDWCLRVMSDLRKVIRTGDTVVFVPVDQTYRTFLEHEILAMGCTIPRKRTASGAPEFGILPEKNLPEPQKAAQVCCKCKQEFVPGPNHVGFVNVCPECRKRDDS